MGLVCRPIQMYNEYVPAIVGNRNWKYQVLGHHDGMDISKPIYLDTPESFQQIYDKYIHEDRPMDYALQSYFGLHDDDGCEEKFWNYKTIFTFVSFIQFKEKEISKYHRYLESQIFLQDKNGINENRMSIRAYYTMDHNDSIIVIKCERYDTGMRFINRLHQEKGHPFEIRNSYSVLAFEREGLGQENFGEELQEIIRRIELRIVEYSQGSIALLYNRLAEELATERSVRVSRYAMLGTDDEAIVIENIPRDRFLGLYADGTGVLCNSNEIVQDCASAITTKIMYSIDCNSDVQGEVGTKGDKPFCSALNKYINYCFDNKNSMSDIAEKKTLIRMANALGKIEYARNRSVTITEYNFFTLFLPFYVFVRLHTNTEGHTNEYYEFLSYFSICTQNYDKPDRVFLQTADFNLRYFEMQTKYFTLYSAYIFRLKQLLNNQGANRYEFILCPGMSEKTEVREFHNREDSKYRLFEVGIAETRMYDIKSMFCILGHEVAHFVGTEIRSRENRYEHMLRINSRVIMLMFQHSFKHKGFDDYVLNSGICDEYEERFTDWIRLYIERMYKREYCERKIGLKDRTDDDISQYIENKKKHQYYTENMLDEFGQAIKEMLKLQGMDIFDELIWKMVDHECMQKEMDCVEKKRIDYVEKKRYIEECRCIVREIIDIFTADNTDGTDAFNITNVLDVEKELLKECYADLIAILSLRLSLVEYLNTLVKETLNVGYRVDKLQGTVIEARIAIIMGVMSYTDDKSKDYFRWTDQDILVASESDDIIKLQNSAMEFRMYIVNPDLGHNSANLIHDSQSIIYDYKFLRQIIAYLLHCRQQFYSETNTEKQKEVLAFKDVAACKGADEFYEKIMGLILEYERDIYSELPKTAQEINERIQEEKTNEKCGKRRK